MQGFRGLLLDSAAVHLPDGLVLPGVTPGRLTVRDAALGTGGSW